MKRYDPHVDRLLTKEQYINECYGGLPSESLLEEQFDKLENVKVAQQVDSHTYVIPKFSLNPSFDLHSNVVIQFLKGEVGKEVHPGFVTETIINLCKVHLESVNQGELENLYTTSAINSLKEALWFLNERVEDRKRRGVFQTYQK